ncbi:MAG: extracellular solute-binding protein, partial [Oscillospiraceae bacterium]
VFCIDGSGDDSMFDDMNKVIQSGVFFDLNYLFEKDSEFNKSDYLESAMMAGSFDGKQYFFPTGIETPIFLSSKQVLEQTKFDLSKCKNTQDFIKQLKSYTENRPPDDNRFILNWGADDPDIYLELLNVIDYKNQSVTLGTSEVKNVFETLKLVCDKTNEDFPKEDLLDENTRVNCFEKNNVLFFGNEMGYGLLDMSALMNDTVEPVLYPTYNNEGKIQAKIATGIAINANSPNKQNAYDFLKLALDWKREPYDKDSRMEHIDRIDGYENIPPEQYLYTKSVFFPVIKARFEYDVDYMKRIFDTGWFYSEYEDKLYDNLENIKIKPLPDEIYKQFKDIYYNIDVCTILNPAIEKVAEIMKPYLEGKKSYEECIENAQDKLEIYISE